jgi:methionyl-tRNA formyltransferase
MRILFMGNNRVGLKAMEWLKQCDEEIVGLVIHSKEKQKYTHEIIECAGVNPDNIFFGHELNKPDVVKKILNLSPDIGVSIFFDYIIREDLFKKIPLGVINLHPAFLPYNRGQYPNVWSIVENTPSGVTLHYINEKLDAGDIISQQTVETEPIDTGKTLYMKLEQASVDLFCKTWPAIKSGTVIRSPQSDSPGTYHRTTDVEQIDKIELEKYYSGRYLIDVLRARSFPPYKGAFFEVNGKRIYLTLSLEYERED